MPTMEVITAPMMFAYRAATDPRRLLALDYDGTLAPLTPARERAFPYDGVKEILCTLVLAQSKVVVISGRSAMEVDRLLNARPRPEIWGSHGRERWVPHEARPRLFGMTPELEETLALIAGAAKRRIPLSHIETKPAGVAVHWRGLDVTAREDLRALAAEIWKPWKSHHLIAWHDFDGGLELRARGRNKGDAIRTLLKEFPNVTAAYLGDDVTDEDAFAQINNRGLSVLVREHWRPTQAETWIRPPQELLQFLSLWAGLEPGGDSKAVRTP